MMLPALSTVFYINAVGGSTLLLNQTVTADNTCVPSRPTVSALSDPVPNTLLTFPGYAVPVRLLT